VELLEKLTMSQYGEKLVQAFHNFLDVNKPDIRQPIHVLFTQIFNQSELFTEFLTTNQGFFFSLSITANRSPSLIVR
jgi:hypothetical protein